MTDDLTQPIWPAIKSHAKALRQQELTELFEKEPQRANRCFLSSAGLSLDYSKNFYTAETQQLLIELCEQSDLEHRRQQMFTGASINSTESRAALHTLLRAKNAPNKELEGAYNQTKVSLDKIRGISEKIRQGIWLGATGDKIRHIVHIGIGGSFLGPHMADEALSALRSKSDDITCHYVANVDGHHISSVLEKLNPSETLVIIVSKTFETLETKANANTAKSWLEATLPSINQHLIAVSTNIDAATNFGVLNDNILPMWDWVGGRYSLWSAVGIPIAIRYGYKVFESLLRGAETMDQHFLNSPPDQNIPVLLAFFGTFYQHCFGAGSHAVLTYDHRLRLLPDHLQQLDMESNGKSVSLSGDSLSHHTGAIIWGGEGTNGQHAFHQLLHQGTRFTSIDFIFSLNADHNLGDHQDKLVSSCLSQAQALMVGRSLEQLASEPSALKRAHKVMPGNKPSNMIILDRLTPETLGALIAMYEHKVFVQAAFWNINPFDQWGVELGKELGQNILNALTGSDIALDPSTEHLLNLYKKARHTQGTK